jgi:acylphosphatase
MIARRIVFAGRVQGVGFRATCRSIARDFGVAGTVRNLPDGTVELVAEGEAGEVDRFVRAVAERMNRYIQTMQSDDAPVASRTDFVIAR